MFIIFIACTTNDKLLYAQLLSTTHTIPVHGCSYCLLKSVHYIFYLVTEHQLLTDLWRMAARVNSTIARTTAIEAPKQRKNTKLALPVPYCTQSNIISGAPKQVMRSSTTSWGRWRIRATMWGCDEKHATTNTRSTQLASRRQSNNDIASATKACGIMGNTKSLEPHSWWFRKSHTNITSRELTLIDRRAKQVLRTYRNFRFVFQSSGERNDVKEGLHLQEEIKILRIFLEHLGVQIPAEKHNVRIKWCNVTMQVTHIHYYGHSDYNITLKAKM